MVKQGYKQTEIGVIPEDWEVKELVDMVELINGRAYSQNELLSRGKYRVLRVGNFFSSDKWYWSDLELSNKFYVENGDLMYAWSASFGPKFWFDEKTIYHYHIWKIDNYRKTDKKFLYHLLVNDKASIQNESQGGTMFHITKEAMEKRKFPLPPLPEQEAIAEALSDADAWIASLEQLIAKKRLIKQGAMQELLTPPSPSSGNADGEALEPWEVKKLGEVAYVTGAGVDKKIVEGEKPVVLLNYLDVYRRDYIYGEELWHEVTAPANKVEQCDIKQGDVLITPSSELANDIGITALAMEDMDNVVYSYHLYRIRFFEELHWKFKLYLFKNRLFLNQAEKFAEGSGKRYVISLSKIREFDIAYPKSLFEQERIATILSDMDAELEALEQKLSKARQIKQGMMQELLTGRIRLV